MTLLLSLRTCCRTLWRTPLFCAGVFLDWRQSYRKAEVERADMKDITKKGKVE